jgi:hypothetical protein
VRPTSDRPREDGGVGDECRSDASARNDTERVARARRGTLPNLLKPREAQAMLAIGSRKLWEITSCGELPCIRIGRSVRYAVEDLLAYIAAHKQSGGPS